MPIPSPLAKKPWSLAFPFLPVCIRLVVPFQDEQGLEHADFAPSMSSVTRAPSGLLRGCHLHPEPRCLSGASCLFTVWQRALQSPGAGGDGGQLTDACVPSTPKQGSGLCQLPKRRGDEQCCRLQQREALLAGCQGRPRGTLTRPGFYGCVCVGSG